MLATEGDSSAYRERQRLLKDEIMPGVLGMDRYLGQVNYGDQFHRREKKGLLNWEFEDKDTKTTFKPTLLGEIADATYGTLLKGKGNFKAPKDSPDAPIQDNSKVKNIIVLRKLAASTTLADRAFLNQTAPLNKIKQEVEEEDEKLKQSPSNVDLTPWVDSTAEINELPGNRHLDLIRISLPRKFGRPPKGTTATKVAQQHVITEIQPLTDAIEGITSTSSIKSTTSEDDYKVEVGKYYEPSLLPDYNPHSFRLVHDKLIQHDIHDINFKLIPAWRIEHELRPGTVICVTVTLHVYNIKNERGNGFRRYFQIDAEKIWIVAEALEEEATSDTKGKGKLQEQNAQTPIIDDFAMYMSKKRNAKKSEDEPDPKKKKKLISDSQHAQSRSSTEDDMDCK